MINFKDAVKGVRFSFGNKDTYTRDEVYEIVDQHNNAIISNVGKDVEREFESFEKAKNTWQSELQAEKERVGSFDKQLNDYKEKVSTFEKEFEEKDNLINRYKEKEETRTAQELLGGLVATGAEVDTYKMLGNAIKEVRFSSDETLDSRKEKIRPIVNGLIETKRYLAPTGAEFDESGKLITSKGTVNNENHEEDGDDDSDRFVLRRRG